jgi:acyl-CoA reductase-like NAD-dependent aldehyde dehydrogenase
MKKMQLEMGGKNPMIVLDDALRLHTDPPAPPAPRAAGER